MKTLLWPLDKVYVTQGFGSWPSHYRKYGLPGHNGIDMRTRFVDSPLGRRYVRAADAGTAYEVRTDAKGYGTHVRVRHPDGSVTIYGHLTKAYVSKGDAVARGQTLGLTGNTGDSTGPHLHFEYRAPGWESKPPAQYCGSVDPIHMMVKGGAS